MNDTIEQFLALVGNYARTASLFAIECAARQPDGARLVELDRKKNHLVRGEILPCGKALAEILEGAGYDCSLLLRFLHAADAGGGAAAALPIWADLKPFLQRIQIRAALPSEASPEPVPEAAPEGPVPEGSPLPEAPPEPPKPPEGEWSIPMSLSEMAKRILRRHNARGREIEAFAKRQGLKRISKRQWCIRVDNMDPKTRNNLDTPLGV